MDKEKRKEQCKQYYLDNKEIIKEKSKQWRLNNKEIIKENQKQRYLNNKEKIKEQCKQYYLDNKERAKQYRIDNIEKIKQYRLDNKEREKQYYLDNKEKANEKNKQRYLNNKEKIKEQCKQYRLNNKEKINKREIYKKKIDPLYKLSYNLRTRIYFAIKSKSWNKNNTTAEILGCDFETVKKHLENQFIDNMSWDNHGLFGWHIDHIKPLAKATTQEELYKLCHYTNLQPLWAADNLSKGAKEL